MRYAKHTVDLYVFVDVISILEYICGIVMYTLTIA